MKKLLLMFLVLLLLLIGCANVKTFDDAKSILEKEGYDLKVSKNKNYFNIDNIDRIIVEKEEDTLFFATIYYCESEEDAEYIYNIIYNLYLSYIYSPDIYGFNNNYKLYYGLSTEPITYSEYQTINYDLLNNLEGSQMSNISYYLFDDLEIVSSFPNVLLPKTYEEFNNKQNYYTPQCFIKGNNVYFGSPKILNILT